MNNTANADSTMDLLLVEDNPGDVRLTKEAFREEGKLTNILHVVVDGIEAMAFLHQEGEYADKPRPDLILLDLNLPRMDGREVLAEIKSDPNLKRIPVIILTTSSAEQDIQASYDLHANSYMTKPVDFDQFIAAVKTVRDYWLSVVKLPPTMVME